MIQNTVSYTIDQISSLFAELLKANFEYLIYGQITKISLASKWCTSLLILFFFWHARTRGGGRFELMIFALFWHRKATDHTSMIAKILEVDKERIWETKVLKVLSKFSLKMWLWLKFILSRLQQKSQLVHRNLSWCLKKRTKKQLWAKSVTTKRKLWANGLKVWFIAPYQIS